MAAKRIKLAIILFTIVTIVVAFITWFGRQSPIEVIAEKVHYGKVQDTVANTRAGTLKACRRAGLSPSIGGQIAKLPVKEGDEVKTAQLLMELWNADRLAEVELAGSELKAARSRAKQACVVAQTARREAQRLQKLQDRGLAAEEAVEHADSEARAKQAGCTAAHATTEVKQAQLDVAKAALDRTCLRAPFDGIVAEVNGEVGEFVTPSPVGIPTPPAVDLVDITCLYVSAPIDEVDAPQIRVGMRAHISLDAFAKQTFDATVRRVAPYVLEMEKQARTVDVEVDFLRPEESQDMLPGYSADIEVILKERKHSLRIPTEAIMQGDRVLVFRQEELLEQRQIKTGLSNWAWTEVFEGLEEGEEVVVSIEREGVGDGVRAVRDSSVSDDD
ncbi:MAG: efflux RND transporter periplasmic adaptor subunit [Pseudomonadota bacterium]